MGRKTLNGKKLNEVEQTQLKQIMFTSRVSSSCPRNTSSSSFLASLVCYHGLMEAACLKNKIQSWTDLITHLFKMIDVIDIMKLRLVEEVS